MVNKLANLRKVEDNLSPAKNFESVSAGGHNKSNNISIEKESLLQQQRPDRIKIGNNYIRDQLDSFRKGSYQDLFNRSTFFQYNKNSWWTRYTN